MKRLLLGLILAVLLAPLAWAQTYVRFADHNSQNREEQNDFLPYAQEVGGNLFELEYEKPGGDGSSEEAPGKIYFPVDSGITPSPQLASHRLIYKALTLPLMKPDAPDNKKANLRVRLDVKNSLGHQAKLWVAVKEGEGNFRIFGRTSTLNHLGFIEDHTEGTGDYTVELASLCQLSFMSTHCSNFNSAGNANTNVLLYFFMEESSATHGSDTQVDPASYPHGVYLQVYLSNRVHNRPSNNVTITEVRKGDARLKLEYIGPTISEIDSVFSFYTTNVGGTLDEKNMEDIAAGVRNGQISTRDLEMRGTNQTADIIQLNNGTEYEVALAFVDKYGFATKTSNSGTGTPLKIEEFLKSQSCYLLSAGFGEEHYVIEYFKDFRDHFLQEHALGRAFIDFYYETAPVYALSIYRTPWLASFVRGGAYLLYFAFVFKGLLFFLAALGCLSFAYLRGRKV